VPQAVSLRAACARCTGLRAAGEGATFGCRPLLTWISELRYLCRPVDTLRIKMMLALRLLQPPVMTCSHTDLAAVAIPVHWRHSARRGRTGHCVACAGSGGTGMGRSPARGTGQVWRRRCAWTEVTVVHRTSERFNSHANYPMLAQTTTRHIHARGVHSHRVRPAKSADGFRARTNSKPALDYRRGRPARPESHTMARAIPLLSDWDGVLRAAAASKEGYR
jgi:hypothetical protein